MSASSPSLQSLLFNRHQPPGHVTEYLTMHYVGIPRHTWSIKAYTILTECVCVFRLKIAVWELSKHIIWSGHAHNTPTMHFWTEVLIILSQSLRSIYWGFIYWVFLRVSAQNYISKDTLCLQHALFINKDIVKHREGASLTYTKILSHRSFCRGYYWWVSIRRTEHRLSNFYRVWVFHHCASSLWALFCTHTILSSLHQGGYCFRFSTTSREYCVGLSLFVSFQINSVHNLYPSKL